MSAIRFDAVTKHYGDAPALSGFSLEVEEGEFVALLGPSGCGKTTALRLIAGFLRPTSGRILVGGTDVSSVPTYKRNVGMVFQDYSLFPHMTVAENVAFGLRERAVEQAAADGRVAELLDLVKLPQMGARYPGELSGGQQQRVALARALAIRPRVLLMDEPFGALDLKLRESMQVELVHIQDKLGITTLLVTHDQGEAMAMADRIVVMNGGRVEQVGRPEDIYYRPSNRFVADFVGRINLLPANVSGLRESTADLAAGDSRFVAPRPAWAALGQPVDIAVRPECLDIAPRDRGGADVLPPDRNSVAGIVVERRFAGATLVIEVESVGHGRLVASAGLDAPTVALGDPVCLSWRTDRTVLLPREN